MYPYPLDGGGKIKTFNTLKTLAQKYQIQAVFITETNPNRKEREELKKLGVGIKIFFSESILASVKDNLPHLFWHLIRGIPHYVFQYTHQPAFAYINNVIKEYRPDIIHIDHLNIAQYLPKEKRETWVLEHHNVETYLYWTRFKHSRKLTRKAYLLIEMILTYLYEEKTLRRFDHVFAISQVEAERTNRLFGIRNLTAQPLVYKQTNVVQKKSKNPYILFIGNLGWPPNEDAVEWFLNQILPKVKQRIPQVEFHVVGKRQPIYEKNWPRPKNFFLHGYQKSLRPFLSEATLFVMPFRMGGGMRIKSLTALAAGLPLVTSPLGVEGLSVTHNKDCLIAHYPFEFAHYIIEIINSASLQKKLRKNALLYINLKHHEGLNNQFLDRYSEIVKKSLLSPNL
jgi:hypothetical protein